MFKVYVSCSGLDLPIAQLYSTQNKLFQSLSQQSNTVLEMMMMMIMIIIMKMMIMMIMMIMIIMIKLMK